MLAHLRLREIVSTAFPGAQNVILVIQRLTRVFSTRSVPRL